MTDVEKIQFERARKLNPNVELLITRLDLDLQTMTPAERISHQVTNRVDQWMCEFSQVKPLEVLEEPTIFTSPEKRAEYLAKSNFSL